MFNIIRATVALPALGTGPPAALFGNGIVLRMTAIGSIHANMKNAPKINGRFRPTLAAMRRMNMEHAASLTAPNIAVSNKSRCPFPTSSWKNSGEKYARALPPVAYMGGRECQVRALHQPYVDGNLPVGRNMSDSREPRVSCSPLAISQLG